MYLAYIDIPYIHLFVCRTDNCIQLGLNMDTFTDLFFPSTLATESQPSPSSASSSNAFPKHAWRPRPQDPETSTPHARESNPIRSNSSGGGGGGGGPEAVAFEFDEGFRDGMVMPAAAQGAPCDPVIRGNGPAGAVRCPHVY